MAHHDLSKTSPCHRALALTAAAAFGALALAGGANAQGKPSGGSNWIKVCGDIQVPVPNKKGTLEKKKTTLCQTFHEQVNRAFGFLRISLQSTKLSKQDRLQVQIPLGMDLRRGIRLAAGTAKECKAVRDTLRASKFPFVERTFSHKAVVMTYATCGGDGRRSPMSCYAEAPATKELIDKMKASACLGIQAFAATGIPPVWVVSLKGFTKAHEGKAMSTAELAKIVRAKNDKIKAAIKKKSAAELAKDPKLAEAYKKLQAAEKEMADALKKKKAAEKKN